MNDEKGRIQRVELRNGITLVAQGDDYDADLDSLVFRTRFVPAAALRYLRRRKRVGTMAIAIPGDRLTAVRFVRANRGTGLVDGVLAGVLAGALTGESLPVVVGGAP